jgi:hypothetical protein
MEFASDVMLADGYSFMVKCIAVGKRSIKKLTQVFLMPDIVQTMDSSTTAEIYHHNQEE